MSTDWCIEGSSSEWLHDGQNGSSFVWQGLEDAWAHNRASKWDPLSCLPGCTGMDSVLEVFTCTDQAYPSKAAAHQGKNFTSCWVVLLFVNFHIVFNIHFSSFSDLGWVKNLLRRCMELHERVFSGKVLPDSQTSYLRRVKHYCSEKDCFWVSSWHPKVPLSPLPKPATQSIHKQKGWRDIWTGQLRVGD